MSTAAKKSTINKMETPTKRSYWKKFLDSYKIVAVPKASSKHSDATGNGEVPAGVEDSNDGFKRTLNNRHIQMIAIGGAIGTGLFIGSGAALSVGGPASLLIGFIIIGTLLYNVVMALAELAVVYPIPGSFSTYASRFMDPAWGFIMGWNYAFGMLIVLPLELSAAAITVRYWNDQLDVGIWITIFWLVIAVINFFGVKGYGEAEFVFSLTKLLAVVGFIILGVVIVCGGAPQGGYRGTRTWSNPGAFHNGLKGFCSVFISAAFAFGGTEMVGLTAAESENPRKTIPAATKQVFWRISIFYIVSLFLVGLIVPYNHPRLLGNANETAHGVLASPFVIAIQDAGIDVLPSIFNAVILISVLSVGNSAVYGSSRLLAALAQRGQAPRWLGLVDRQGRPIVSIILALAIGAIAYLGELGASASGDVFHWLLSITGLSGFFIWMTIAISHIMFRKAWKTHGHTLDELPFRAAFGEYGSWYAVVMIVLILFAQFYIAIWPSGYDTMSHGERALLVFKTCMTVPVILIGYVFWKLLKRTPFMVAGKGHKHPVYLLSTETIDLQTGRKDRDLSILEKERQERAEQPTWKRIYHSLCG